MYKTDNESVKKREIWKSKLLEDIKVFEKLLEPYKSKNYDLISSIDDGGFSYSVSIFSKNSKVFDTKKGGFAFAVFFKENESELLSENFDEEDYDLKMYDKHYQCELGTVHDVDNFSSINQAIDWFETEFISLFPKKNNSKSKMDR